MKRILIGYALNRIEFDVWNGIVINMHPHIRQNAVNYESKHSMVLIRILENMEHGIEYEKNLNRI